MATAKTPGDRLYYFSAAFGQINRVMNFHCDPALVFAHQVIQQLHQSLFGRLTNALQSGDETAGMPEEMFLKLDSIAADLHSAIAKQSNEDLWKVLQSASNLGYATTGNGYYLYLQGKLKL